MRTFNLADPEAVVTEMPVHIAGCSLWATVPRRRPELLKTVLSGLQQALGDSSLDSRPFEPVAEGIADHWIPPEKLKKAYEDFRSDPENNLRVPKTVDALGVEEKVTRQGPSSPCNGTVLHNDQTGVGVLPEKGDEWQVLRSEISRASSSSNPSHYREHPSGVECIEITRHFNFALGNAIKYVWRAGLKSDSPIEDLEKAQWYLEDEIARLKRGGQQ